MTQMICLGGLLENQKRPEQLPFMGQEEGVKGRMADNIVPSGNFIHHFKNELLQVTVVGEGDHMFHLDIFSLEEDAADVVEEDYPVVLQILQESAELEELEQHMFFSKNLTICDLGRITPFPPGVDPPSLRGYTSPPRTSCYLFSSVPL